MAHGLDTAGRHHIASAAQHRLGGEMHRLLGGAALPVYGHARHMLRQPGGQPAGAGDVPGQRADGVNAAEHHIFVVVRRHLIALHQSLERMTAQIGRVQLVQPAPAPPRGGAQGVNDVGLGHVAVLLVSNWACRRISLRRQ